MTRKDLPTLEELDEWDACKADVYDVLARFPNEVPGLLAAIEEGRIDGNSYKGRCSCLIGTLGTLQVGTTVWTKNFVELMYAAGREPNGMSLAERVFSPIAPGETPATSERSSLVRDWVRDWLLERGK